jgi:hypothetical protein
MVEWIQNLETEFVVLFGFSVIFFLMLLVTLRRNQRILDLIGKRALTLQEDLIHRDGEDYIDVLIANTSYVNVEAGAVGFIYKKVYLPLKEESILVLARDSHKISIPLENLRSFVIGQSVSVSKIYVYVEDSLGRKTIKRAKNSTRKLREILKNENKLQKIEDRKIRFETGKYRFFERIGLILAFLFSPFIRLSRAIKNGLNKRLKNREVKLEIIAKEKKHKDEMQQVFDEQRREELILQAEKKILAEKKAREAELKLAEKKRREEMKKVLEEQKEYDEIIAQEEKHLEELDRHENSMKNNENKMKTEPDKIEEKTSLEQVESVDEKQNEQSEIDENQVEKEVIVKPKKPSSKKKKIETDDTESKES